MLTHHAPPTKHIAPISSKKGQEVESSTRKNKTTIQKYKLYRRPRTCPMKHTPLDNDTRAYIPWRRLQALHRIHVVELNNVFEQSNDPVHADNAGIVPAGIVYFWTVFVWTGIGNRIFSPDFPVRERKKPQENKQFPWESFGWDWEIKISTGTIWVGTGNRDCSGYCLVGTTGMVFAQEREKSQFP